MTSCGNRRRRASVSAKRLMGWNGARLLVHRLVSSCTSSSARFASTCPLARFPLARFLVSRFSFLLSIMLYFVLSLAWPLCPAAARQPYVSPVVELQCLLLFLSFLLRSSSASLSVYQDRQVQVQVFLFPSLGCGYETDVVSECPSVVVQYCTCFYSCATTSIVR